MAIRRILCAVVAALFALGTVFIPSANAASASGSKRCATKTSLYLTTYTYSSLRHTHTHKPTSGKTVTRTGSGTTYTSVSPFLATSWTATNGVTESWRSTPSAICLPSPE